MRYSIYTNFGNLLSLVYGQWMASGLNYSNPPYLAPSCISQCKHLLCV